METDTSFERPEPIRRQSRLGIAAFISVGLSLCILLGYLGLIFAYLMAPYSLNNINIDIPVIIFTVLGLAGLFVLIGFILGIVTLFQKNKKKVFAILAIVGSILVVLLMVVSFFTYFIFTS